MFHQHFLSEPGTDLGPLDSGERVLWRGRCAVAEYAFDEASSLPRWTLPEDTEVLVTDRRVRYTHAASDTLRSGELFWLWPQHLRVQPGNREVGRNATVTQIQLVCNGPGGSFPALVFAGGTLGTVGDADRLANVLRQAISRFRVENAGELGVPAPQVRMLSRLVIGPEFSNYQGGQGQTISLLGSVPVPGNEEPEYAEPQHEEPLYAEAQFAEPQYAEAQYAEAQYAEPQHTERRYAEPAYAGSQYAEATYDEPAPISAAPVSATPVSSTPISATPVSATPVSATPVSAGHGPGGRPGREADAQRAEEALRAELAARQAEPDLASRAASLAARVASLMSASEEQDRSGGRLEGQTSSLSAYLARRADAERDHR